MNWFAFLAVVLGGGYVTGKAVKWAEKLMRQEEYRMRMTGNRPTEPTVFCDGYGNEWCPQIRSEKHDHRR